MNLLEHIISFPWLLESGYEIGLNWLGKFAMVIIEGVGIIGLGIIVFTLVLKAITLPFDIYQRVKMRKQTLIMRSMQDDLEKLQKQYANDKTMYNQKMMELYKKNGYSMLGACLPMILSLVILIVAFTGFRTYSQYANLSMYEKMSVQYNAAILEHSVDGVDYRLAQEGISPELIVEWEEGKTWENEGIVYKMYSPDSGNTKRLEVISTDETKYLFYSYSLDETLTYVNRQYNIDVERLQKTEGITEKLAEQRKIMVEKRVNELKETENAPEDENAVEQWEKDLAARAESEISEKDVYIGYVARIGALRVKDWYRDGNNASFLWVKNVWYADVSYYHPIQDYNKFKDQLNTTVITRNGDEKSLSNVLDKGRYDALTAELESEKEAPNGYFILIILSIGLMVISQFISMRSHKESKNYQTVDGRGAMSQKVMLIVMPLIYAVFAFMYSAAFSIYMVMSSALSIIVTLLSNLIIGAIFKKKEEEMLKEKYSRRLPWQQNGKGNNSDKKKDRNKRK